MSSPRITWGQNPHSPYSAARVSSAANGRIRAEIARLVGVEIPIVEGVLSDVKPEGVVLWNAYGADVTEPFRASTPERVAELVSTYAARVVVVDVAASRLLPGMELLRLGGAIDTFSHRNWTSGTVEPALRRGMFGRREIAPLIDVVCDESVGSENYVYMTGRRSESLPQLVADYVVALHALTKGRDE